MQIHALQEIILSIAEAHLLDPILELIVRGIAANEGVALARLWLLQRDRDCPICQSLPTGSERALHLRGSAGVSQRTQYEYSIVGGRFHRIPLGERKIGQIAASGKAMLIPKVTGEEDWIAEPDWIRDEGIQSFAGQPLIFHGETLGVLAVFSRVQFSEEDFLWLRTFADHAAVAIANARRLRRTGTSPSQTRSGE
jgi:GAF domain-containing protein